MSKIKLILKKCPAFYRFIQNNYHWFRKIVEEKVLGTKFQEEVWKRRKTEWAQEFLNANSSPPHRKLLIEKIEDLRPFGNILEIGCATGVNLGLLVKGFPDIEAQGIDINPIVVKIGNEHFKKEGILNVKLLVGRADDLEKFPDKSFDIVFAGAVLMYIGPDKIRRIASNMQRIARKAIIVAEYHSEKESALGVYNKGNWLRNYEKLFQSPSSKIKIAKISSSSQNEDWEKFGYVIEDIL